jgi:hypothetical protein
MSRIVAIVAVTLANCSLRKHLVIIVDVLSYCIGRIAFTSFIKVAISTISSINFIDTLCSTIVFFIMPSREQILRIVRCLVANVVTLRHITDKYFYRYTIYPLICVQVSSRLDEFFFLLMRNRLVSIIFRLLQVLLFFSRLLLEICQWSRLSCFQSMLMTNSALETPRDGSNKVTRRNPHM